MNHERNSNRNGSQVNTDKPWLDRARTFQERAKLLLAAMTAEEKLSQVNYRNQAVPRLGMNAYVRTLGGAHGPRTVIGRRRHGGTSALSREFVILHERGK